MEFDLPHTSPFSEAYCCSQCAAPRLPETRTSLNGDLGPLCSRATRQVEDRISYRALCLAVFPRIAGTWRIGSVNAGTRVKIQR
jgi:hypothetical protein